VTNDFCFYGNKLFQSSFIAALYPDVRVILVVGVVVGGCVCSCMCCFRGAAFQATNSSKRSLVCPQHPLSHTPSKDQLPNKTKQTPDHPTPNPTPQTPKPHPDNPTPQATPFERMQWTILNSFISLLGYYVAAALVDKRWYGRRTMQVGGMKLQGVNLGCVNLGGVKFGV